MNIRLTDYNGATVIETNRAFIIGRSNDPDVKVKAPVPSASRRHCMLAPLGGRWWVQDLSSHNGTFIVRPNGGARVWDKAPLKDGDRLLIGGLYYEVALPEVDEEARPCT